MATATAAIEKRVLRIVGILLLRGWRACIDWICGNPARHATFRMNRHHTMMSWLIQLCRGIATGFGVFRPLACASGQKWPVQIV
jgi:hypothetical protein